MAPNKKQLAQLLQAGNLAAAIRTARAILDRAPEDAATWYMLAGVHAQLGEIDQLIHCCRNVIRIDPAHGGAHYNLALALLHRGMNQEARRHLLAAIDSNPENASAWLQLGKLQISEGQYQDAIRSLENSARLAPTVPDTLFHLARAYQASENDEKALDVYRQIVNHDPEHVEAANNMAQILEKQGHHQEALSIFRRLSSQRPELPEIWNNMAVVLEDMGDMAGAEKAYRAALERNPALIDTWIHLGFMLGSEGRPDEAMHCFQEASRLDPHNASAIAGQASTLEKQGDIEGASKTLNDFTAAGGQPNADIILARARVMRQQGRLEDAIDLTDTFLSSAPLPLKARIDLNFMLGDLHDSAGAHDLAFSHYRQGNELTPFNYDHQAQVRLTDRIIASTGDIHIDNRHEAEPGGKRMIFIVGLPRSGTSLVEQIISSHTNVYGAGELRELGELANRVLTKPGSPYPESLSTAGTDDIALLAGQYMKTICSLSGDAPVVTDKMPHNFQHIALIGMAFPGARVIHVRRSPLDNCLSLYFHSLSPAHAYATHLDTLGMYHREYRRLMEHWENLSPAPILTIDYEEIVNDLEGATRKMLEFCRLGWEPGCLDFHRNKRFVKTPSYDQVRKPIYSSSIGRWKQYREYLQPLAAALEMPWPH